MYRLYRRTVGYQSLHQRLSACHVMCRHVSTDNSDGTTPPKPRRSGIRRVVPSDEEMAELHDLEQEVASTTSSRSKQSALSGVMVEPMRFSTSGDSGMEGAGDDLGELEAEGDEEGVGTNSLAEAENVYKRHNDGGALEKRGLAIPPSGKPTDPLLANRDGEGEGGAVPLSQAEEMPVSRSTLERQACVRSLSLEELVEAVTLYLRATKNPRLVSADEEHIFFPVLMERLNEFHVSQLLDVVECHWARSTLVRYGTTFKDMVRDRIALIATAAAKSASKRPAAAGESVNDNRNGGAVEEEADDYDEQGDAVYVHEAEEKTSDLIILRAAEEMSPETVLRCIIVMGMSAGRRKRDLQFFQAMGMFLVHHINHYKDPHELVRVLTAFARAKIVPPKRFLALLGRRFAVLNKRKKLGSLPSYRAFVNLYKMGHDQMNTFRFLADCILETIDSNVKAEKKRLRLAQLQSSSNITAATTNGNGATNESGCGGSTSSSNPTVTNTTGAGDLKATHTSEGASDVAFIGDLDPHLLQNLRARERFKRLTELKPSMFTKLLLVLARFGAPHQQYLRPTTVPLILPTLRAFPPPSFTRLLRAMSLFRTTDLDLIEPVIDFMADSLGPTNVVPADVLQMVRLVAPPDVPVPRNLVKLISLCEAVYSSSASFSHSDGKSSDSTDAAACAMTTLSPIRPGDMCAVAVVLLKIQMKDDVPLEALDPLTRLMEFFVERMYLLMKLHIVSLTHVDVFTDLCRQQQHPDVSGHIERLCAERRRVNDAEGDDEYYSQLDIDVRETLHRILIVNDYNTYGQYRPTPGVLQVDFKQALTEVSAFDVLEAADLFAQAFSNALKPAVERHLSRSIIAKLDGGGEEVITEGNSIVLRPPRELLLTREDLGKFVCLLQRTPLRRVRASPVVWRFVEEKAKKLGMDDVLRVVENKLATAV
ncbi:mitochondrial RNA binding complex 1 subunit [Trypanosoma brucei equiperdum]|uniref:Mitochondrial RNA binding complex 1 subunit n=1 Tax=Trypanosoma brucei equiperdum TaxID=630700 RepID=A0A3L6L4A3_9TRYP|nr:mitochondrial RNA binding complex 1 subunit [Trypanosoma brucei equiperdum]